MENYFKILTYHMFREIDLHQHLDKRYLSNDLRSLWAIKVVFMNAF